MPNVSVICDVIDALVARFRAALPDVRVSDGILLGDEAETRKLEVGVDDPGSARAGARSGSSDLEWAGLGNRARDEQVRVRCAASARVGETGDAGAKLARDAAKEILDAVQADLYADPAVGGALYGLVSEIELMQGQNRNGAVCQFTFVLSFRARLTV